jgi:hypothetical protein
MRFLTTYRLAATVLVGPKAKKSISHIERFERLGDSFQQRRQVEPLINGLTDAKGRRCGRDLVGGQHLERG